MARAAQAEEDGAAVIPSAAPADAATRSPPGVQAVDSAVTAPCGNELFADEAPLDDEAPLADEAPLTADADVGADAGADADAGAGAATDEPTTGLQVAPGAASVKSDVDETAAMPAPVPPALSASAAPTAAACEVCGGTCGLVRCGATLAGVCDPDFSVCRAWLHPSCALDAGRRLSSCAHLGAELYFALCAEHSQCASRCMPCAPRPAAALGSSAPLAALVGGHDDVEARAGRLGSGWETAADGEPLPPWSGSPPTHLSRASKLARLAAGATAADEAAAAAARAGGPAAAWWWALRVDLIPPSIDAALCEEGSVRRGGDDRQWRVVVVDGARAIGDEAHETAPARAEDAAATPSGAAAAAAVDSTAEATPPDPPRAAPVPPEAPSDGASDVRLPCEPLMLWAPLAADGTVAPPTAMPPPPLTTTPRESGLLGRTTAKPVGWLTSLAAEHLLDAEMEPSLLAGGAAGARRNSSAADDDDDLVRYDATRYELPGLRIDRRLWPGAAAAGWRAIESYVGGRRNAAWVYQAPDGSKHRSRHAALDRAEQLVSDAAHAHGDKGSGRGGGRGRGRGRGQSQPTAIVYPRVKLVMSRGGAPAPAEPAAKKARQ